MRNSSILIVEDENLLAFSIKRILEHEGYKVSDILAYGEKVMANINKDCPDVVLMDINLKGEMTGIDVAKQIQCSSDLPVIYMTAYSDDNTLQKAKETNPQGFLKKPVSDNDLLNTIEKILKK